MKKLSVILISFLLLFNSFGYIFVYLEVKQSLKNDAFDKLHDFIPGNDIDIFRLSKKELIDKYDDLIENNEITHNDKLYDIIEKYESNDSVILYCLWDEKESSLEKAFTTYINTLTTKDSPMPALKNILLNKLSAGILTAVNNLFPKKTEELISFSNQFFITNYFEVPTPPPRYII